MHNRSIFTARYLLIQLNLYVNIFEVSTVVGSIFV